MIGGRGGDSEKVVLDGGVDRLLDVIGDVWMRERPIVEFRVIVVWRLNSLY